jgi:hypothetical protein
MRALQAHEPFVGYSDDAQPLGAYLALSIAFTAGLGGTLALAGRRGRLPDTIPVVDVLGVALATHKLARLITKDSATSFVRAPFVCLEEKSGSNSLEEQPRGHGVRRTLGELLTCPECTGQWVAAGLTGSLLHAPRVTRTISILFSALTVADLLQFVHVGLKERA